MNPKPLSEESKTQFREMLESGMKHEALQRKIIQSTRRLKWIWSKFGFKDPPKLKDIEGIGAIVVFVIGIYLGGIWFWVGSGLFLYVGFKHWSDYRHT